MLQNTIKSLRTRRRSKKGFTLMEMLIVVAIIAILIAIAIPVFSVQLNNAREKVDAANERSARSMAVTDYLSNEKSGEVIYLFEEDTDSNFTISKETAATAINGYNQATYGTGDNALTAGKAVIKVTINATTGKATSEWVAGKS